MTRFFCRLGMFLIVLCGALRLCADDAIPKISLVQSGADALYTDLDYVFSLTNPEDQKQLPILKQYIDAFLVGLDRKKPMRMDVILTGDTRRYNMSLPVADVKVFRNNNLNPLGVTSRPRGVNFFQLMGAFVGFMRQVDDYVVFSEDRNEIPRQMPHPIKVKEIQGLLEKKYDLAGEMTNQPAGQDVRHKRIQKERSEIIGALKQTKDETPDDFALRKKFFDVQFDEGERL